MLWSKRGAEIVDEIGEICDQTIPDENAQICQKHSCTYCHGLVGEYQYY